jgi:hypothetical protein
VAVDIGAEYMRAMNKLTKWRAFFASWQLGTRRSSDGECRAVRDHREVTIICRAELSALAGLLIKKGVFTQEEFTGALTAEAKRLDHDYEEHFPGWRSTEAGMSMKMPEAGETMRELGFPS